MQTILAAILLTGFAMLALAAGLFAGRAPLKGSCGGAACGGKCHACERSGGSGT
ncbi:hypothetical protein [Agrobacterium pusense]|uniref:hypothetical protein n=1 Tax=Agrobacterium pusense TaxID=648995 RepID=UPI00244A362E|nr:hypothetical protein [Agrobacterium pusense]MDH0871737.1 hypothetical protein [Agrobacterium pusense]